MIPGRAVLLLGALGLSCSQSTVSNLEGTTSRTPIPVGSGAAFVIDHVAIAIEPLIELLGRAYRPDVHRDGDGFEWFELGPEFALEGYDGDRSRIPPMVANEPGTCAQSPRVADAYSLAVEFTAVRATILGVDPAL